MYDNSANEPVTRDWDKLAEEVQKKIDTQVDWKLLVYRIRRNKRNKVAKMSRKRNRK